VYNEESEVKTTTTLSSVVSSMVGEVKRLGKKKEMSQATEPMQDMLSLRIKYVIPRLNPLVLNVQGSLKFSPSEIIQGKACNQRNGLLFAWGFVIQTKDANQGGTLAEAVKFPVILHRFQWSKGNICFLFTLFFLFFVFLFERKQSNNEETKKEENSNRGRERERVTRRHLSFIVFTRRASCHYWIQRASFHRKARNYSSFSSILGMVVCNNHATSSWISWIENALWTS
jgi:hypothetical protein